MGRLFFHFLSDNLRTEIEYIVSNTEHIEILNFINNVTKDIRISAQKSKGLEMSENITFLNNKSIKNVERKVSAILNM
jgi:hypothetical protein